MSITTSTLEVHVSHRGCHAVAFAAGFACALVLVGLIVFVVMNNL